MRKINMKKTMAAALVLMGGMLVSPVSYAAPADSQIEAQQARNISGRVLDAQGQPVADFVMNRPEYSESPRQGVHEIIIGGQNWGSGSSREHAAWAIAGYGVRVVISSSFADIHRNNLLNCFVLPVIVSREFQQELFDTIEANPAAEVKVDVPNQTVTNLATGHSETFDINGYKKYCLMNALDDIDFLLENKEKISAFEMAR
jgi:3-isopropylmalate/(R)-2-methylmalate dehydratase small subunit